MTKDSVYEILDPLSTVRKTKFWDWFDGNDLRSWWTKTFTGSGTIVMSDAVDGGALFTTGASSGNNCRLHFNDIRHYDQNASRIIAVWRDISTVSARFRCGFGNDNNLAAHFMLWQMDTVATFFTIRSEDATTATSTDSSIPTDFVFHIFDMEINSTNIIGRMDGVLEITKSDRHPEATLQPLVHTSTQTTAAKTGELLYMEAFST